MKVSVLDSILFKGALYLATILTTLRAGSKVFYAIDHGGTIGLMDGPLILGPEDVISIRKEQFGPDNVGDGGKMKQPIEVSPLWETTYAFQQAVRLLYNLDDSDRENMINLGVSSTSKREREMLKGYYSMAAPHKTYQTRVKAPENSSSQKLCGSNTEKYGDKSLVIIDSKREKKTGATFLKALKRKSQDAIISGFRTCTEFGKLFHPDPNDLRDKLTSHQEVEISADYDTILSKTIDVPSTDGKCTDDKLNESTTSRVKKVAHVKAFAPNTFRTLRSWFGIKESDFISSFLEKGPFVSFQSNSKGAARVGGFFFFTRDGVYMIKTIKKSEVSSILNMLPRYFEFMKKNAKRSLLTRFCGLYSVQLSYLSGSKRQDDNEHVFLIMNCVFPAEASSFISERFDLKGSTVGRECSIDEKEQRGPDAILKDLDLANEINDMRSSIVNMKHCGITIGPSAKSSLLSQLRRDLSLLIACNVMDYSLLVGVVSMSGVDATQRSNSLPARKIALEKGLQSKRRRRRLTIFKTLVAPIRLLFSPIAYFGKKVSYMTQSIISSVITVPLPYYGAGACGIDCGPHSIIHGNRLGHRAVFYLGVIDFLQPWTTQKILEREMKGFLGYDTKAISCMHPKDYASRFLGFLDDHIN